MDTSYIDPVAVTKRSRNSLPLSATSAVTLILIFYVAAMCGHLDLSHVPHMAVIPLFTLFFCLKIKRVAEALQLGATGEYMIELPCYS